MCSDMQELWLLVSVVTLIKCSTEPRIQLSFPKFSLIKSTIYELPYKIFIYAYFVDLKCFISISEIKKNVIYLNN